MEWMMVFEEDTLQVHFTNIVSWLCHPSSQSPPTLHLSPPATHRKLAETSSGAEGASARLMGTMWTGYWMVHTLTIKRSDQWFAYYTIILFILYNVSWIKYTIRSIVCEASCHSVTRSLSHSVTRSLGHLVTRSPGHSVTWSLGHPVTRSPSHPVTRSPGHPVTWSPGHSVTRSLGHPVTRSPGHSVTRSPGHSVTRSPSHLVIRSLGHPFFQHMRLTD